MAKQKFDQQKILVTCASCGHEHRNHLVLYEKVIRFCSGPDEPEEGRQYHRFVECMGCNTPKYVISEIDFRNDGPFGDGPYETNVVIHPNVPRTGRRAAVINNTDCLIPKSVWKMYSETIEAVNANVLTLAGGGLRAIVEAICLDKGLAEGSLQNKTDELARQGFLTSPQAELLHEERYLGNAALHELETPSAEDIEDGMYIVEGLINTIYILPAKAVGLKNRRVTKAKPKSAVKKKSSET